MKYEQTKNMNIPLKTKALTDAAADRLRALGLAVQPQKRPPAGIEADAWLRIAREKLAADYVVEAKARLNEATLAAALNQLKYLATAAKQPGLLVADYITPAMAARIREAGHEFVDAVGNAYINRPGTLIFVTGMKPEKQPPKPAANRVHTTAGLKIQFAFLCLPELATATQREIATAAAVALGTVPPVLADLREQGMLLTTKARRQLRITRRLVDDWALGYALRLRPKTLLRTYETPNFQGWKDWKLDPKHVRWGGEPGANLLVGYLRPGILTLYADKAPARLIVEQRMNEARTAIKEGTVELRRRFWGERLDTANPPNVVAPILVYADLLATGDARCIETAELVYEKHIARLVDAR